MTDAAANPSTALKLIVEYDGTRYNGIQRQTSNSKRPPKRPRYDEEGRKKGVPCTIQDCIEESFMLWIPGSTVTSLRLRFAGRTDKGVHARGQVVVVDLLLTDKEEEEDWEICRAINTRLPMDVSIQSAERCSPSFEPRLECKNKMYSYTIRYRRISRDSVTKEPLLICQKGGPHLIRTALDSPCLWVCPWALDDTNIPQICQSLSGYHDYVAFIHKDDRLKRDYTLTLSKFEFEILQTRDDDSIVTAQFRLEAKGFGRSMVRNLVGFVVDVARGNVDEKEVHEMWSADRASLVCSAPASGLCLEQVWF